MIKYEIECWIKFKNVHVMSSSIYVMFDVRLACYALQSCQVLLKQRCLLFIKNDGDEVYYHSCIHVF